MRKKILLLNTTFKSEGPNHFLWQLGRNVDPSHYEIIFGCMSQGGPMEEVYRNAGYKTCNFGMERLYSVGAAARVRDFIKVEGIDLVTAQLLRAEVFGGWGTRLAGVPLVFTTLNMDPYRANPLFFPHYYLSLLSMRWPVKIAAVSEHVRKFIINHQYVPAEKVTTIHCTTDIERFLSLGPKGNALEEELGLGDAIVIGTAARLDIQKGLTYLLQAFRILSGRHPKLRLVIVGDGPERERLRKWVSDNKLMDRIFFMGFRHDFDVLMQGFDIFVLPSLWEGFPLVILGAMALGKPIVASSVAGIPEAVMDGVSGFLVPPGDVLALSEKIEAFIRDPALGEKFGKRARDRVLEFFSPSVMAGKYQKLWDDCLR